MSDPPLSGVLAPGGGVDLSGQDFFTLVRAGHLPVSFVFGTCVYHVAHQGMMQSMRQMGQNVEMPQYTQAVYDARELAMGRMQYEVERDGANGAVGRSARGQQPRVGRARHRVRLHGHRGATDRGRRRADATHAGAAADRPLTDRPPTGAARPATGGGPGIGCGLECPVVDARQWLGLQSTHNPMRWYLPVTPGICTGHRFLFGGCALGAAISAMEGSTGRPVVWATAQYLNYARPPSVVDIDITIASEGRNTTQARAVAQVGDTEILTVNAALGDRALDLSGQWPEMPEVDAARRPASS